MVVVSHYVNFDLKSQLVRVPTSGAECLHGRADVPRNPFNSVSHSTPLLSHCLDSWADRRSDDLVQRHLFSDQVFDTDGPPRAHLHVVGVLRFMSST